MVPERRGVTRAAWLTPRPDTSGEEASVVVTPRQRGERSRALGASWVLLLLGALIGLAWSMEHTTFDVWGAFFVGPVLLLLTLPIALRLDRKDPGLGRLVMLALFLRFTIGSVTRYFVAFSVYEGSADAARYHAEGVRLATLFRSGAFDQLGRLSGTRFIEVLTGAVYAVSGPTKLGGYMIYSWFSFLGLLLFYRAFRVGYPTGDHKRYALLLLFFPSLVYWPSSIGKDAWMLLVLGLCAYGSASMLSGRLRGLLPLGLGLSGVAAVRPHLGLVLLAGLVVAVPLGRLGPERRDSAPGLLERPGVKIISLVALLLITLFVVSKTERFFHLDKLDLNAAETVVEKTANQTSKGGSEFQGAIPKTPSEFGSAVVTVVFRPLPTEVPSVQGLLAGMEGMVLLLIILSSLGRLRRLPVEALRRAYVAFALCYSMAFIMAFSSINNFGILARERVQLLPVLFVLLAIARPRPWEQPEPSRPPPVGAWLAAEAP
jgi:hypothetical protein